jgi:glycosyltransferase involved in cell wall biosynthesis
MSSQANPLISIILPVRNREEYLHACIESIRAQTYPYWELLVYDDDSTDRTTNIATEFEQSDARIRMIPFRSNGATGKIKNAGIKEAKGDIICFMDSDDLWPSEKLQKQWEALKMPSSAAFSFTNGYNFNDADGCIIEWFFEKKTGIETGNFFLDICSGNKGLRFPTLMIRKEAIDHLPFGEDRLFTDLTFILELARQNKGVLLYEPLFQRRCHSKNESSSGWNSDYEEHTTAIKQYMNMGALSTSEAKKILAQLHLHWGANWIAEKHFPEGRKHFLRAWGFNKWSIIPFKKMVRSFYEQMLLHRS